MILRPSHTRPLAPLLPSLRRLALGLFFSGSGNRLKPTSQYLSSFLLPLLLSFPTSPTIAEIAPPDYKWAILQSVYPSGAQRGTSVKVQFGIWEGGAEGASGILIDGPTRNHSPVMSKLKATPSTPLSISRRTPHSAARMVRVHGGKAGLTNFRWFEVSDLPEYIEEDVKRANNTIQKPNDLTRTPIVVNGRIQDILDQDCFRFSATKGQSIVAGVASHAIDAMGFDRNTRGFADLNLELLDASGRVVASAGDTVGFDPIIEFQAPEEGDYIARVSCLGYTGFPQAVYRLTLGDIGYVTSIFPGGGQLGESVEAELSGPNIKKGTKTTLLNDSSHTLTHLPSSGSLVTHRRRRSLVRLARAHGNGA